MAEIEQLPPTYRVPPSRPAAGRGHSREVPPRRPRDDKQRHEQQRRRRDGDDVSHIDEYA